jgi:phage FluMu protein Com
MQEVRKILASNDSNPMAIDPTNSHTSGSAKEDKPKVVVQTNLTPVRCGSCNALLAKGTMGSLLAIVCGRCKTYNLIEIQRNLADVQKKP